MYWAFAIEIIDLILSGLSYWNINSFIFKTGLFLALMHKNRHHCKYSVKKVNEEYMENKNALKQHFGNLGDFLKDKREQKNLTQTDVAKACSCKSQFVSNWERGMCSPPWDILKKLLKLYDIPEKQIFNFLMKEHEKLIITNLGIKTKKV